MAGPLARRYFRLLSKHSLVLRRIIFRAPASRQLPLSPGERINYSRALIICYRIIIRGGTIARCCLMDDSERPPDQLIQRLSART